MTSSDLPESGLEPQKPQELVVTEVEKTDNAKVAAILQSCYERAEALHKAGDSAELSGRIGTTLSQVVSSLSTLKHASRGALLTLCLYKAVRPDQDIRHNKSDHPHGFNARGVDSAVTVKFLQAHSLPMNVETHWLSQTLSFGTDPWTRAKVLNTTPKNAGPLLIDLVNTVEEIAKGEKEPEGTEKDIQEICKDIATLILYEFIDIRNRGKVLLTRPKTLTIDQIVGLVALHFRRRYQRNGPRLPQVAIYAIYKCLVNRVSRYSDYKLEPLARMKSADRKAGTIGDIVLKLNDHPIEAVETKLNIPVGVDEVAVAIDKIRTGSVERYFILSTVGINKDEAEDVRRLCTEFRASNGCEIIVNGVLETIKYYLRLLPSQNEFILSYADLVESDVELDYEHRIAWNEICAQYVGG